MFEQEAGMLTELVNQAEGAQGNQHLSDGMRSERMDAGNSPTSHGNNATTNSPQGTDVTKQGRDAMIAYILT